MNREFAAKLLQQLNQKKGNKNKGFTLIELLVVVIIIGVLAAVALPNLLSQVGKARESEAKNAVGTINRTQQAYHFEKQVFTPALTNANLAANNVLGVIVSSKYFNVSTGAGTAAATNALADSNDGQTGKKDGVRNYSGGIGFDNTTSQYNQVVCQNDTVGTAAQTVTLATAPACPANTTLIK